MMEWIALALLGIAAVALITFAFRPDSKGSYASWRTIDLWDRAKDKSHDHRPTAIREWSDR